MMCVHVGGAISDDVRECFKAGENLLVRNGDFINCVQCAKLIDGPRTKVLKQLFAFPLQLSGCSWGEYRCEHWDSFPYAL